MSAPSLRRQPIVGCRLSPLAPSMHLFASWWPPMRSPRPVLSGQRPSSMTHQRAPLAVGAKVLAGLARDQLTLRRGGSGDGMSMIFA
jgi:hypothetical protein